ncbi:DUF3419 family protein [Vibrio sp. T11.5]|uniref:DUF3419 family protein n=1 Tax=Vibrio sp. T11.5 TaxID=2998836 RepID=UPI0022CDA077|nr:DUF3419 family protein [Vibrio sp. T11.5]MDA0120052.1 DUF3419 family protein [Vibrio sp. T11.5]
MGGLYALSTSQTSTLPLLYGQVREDVSVDLQALALSPHDRVLTITSGGCSALRFLAEAPQQVTAIDINASQSALLALKCAAITQWDRQACREFLGDLPASSSDRLDGWSTLKSNLSPDVEDYWNKHLNLVAKGVNQAGRTDRLSVWTGRILHYVTHWPNLFDALMAIETLEEQREFYRQHFDTQRWRTFLALCVNNITLRRVYGEGFSRALEKHESPAVHLRRKIARAFDTTLLKHNPLMTQLLFGRNPPDLAGAAYLKEGVYDKVKANLDRLNIVTEDLTKWVVRPEQQGQFNKLALSNAMECVPRQAVGPFLQRLVHSLPRGAVIVNRSMMGQGATTWPADLCLDHSLSAKLSEAERAYMYSAVSVFRKRSSIMHEVEQ